jgi:hypothetical protein
MVRLRQQRNEGRIVFSMAETNDNIRLAGFE